MDQPDLTDEELDALLADMQEHVREEIKQTPPRRGELLARLAERYPEDWGEVLYEEPG